MTKHRLTTLAGALCTLLLCLVISSFPSWGLLAPPAQDSDFTMEGKITDKAAGKLTINSGDNIIFHVLYNDKTEIKKKDGSAGSADDLHLGLTIYVAGDLAENGEITAKKIAIEEGAETK
jgi:hypothetical protein